MRKDAGEVVRRRRSIQAVITMVVAVLTADNAGAAGGADGILSICPREPHPAFRQSVHIRSDGLRVAFIARACCLMLIRDHTHTRRSSGARDRARPAWANACCSFADKAATAVPIPLRRRNSRRGMPFCMTQFSSVFGAGYRRVLQGSNLSIIAMSLPISLRAGAWSPSGASREPQRRRGAGTLAPIYGIPPYIRVVIAATH